LAWDGDQPVDRGASGGLVLIDAGKVLEMGIVYLFVALGGALGSMAR
jgi:hypothetical protein